MTDILVPFTMLSLRTPVPKMPSGVSLYTRSAYEQVLSTVPKYLQGTEGVLQLITTFLGSNHHWVCVRGDFEIIYKRRQIDLYLLFWICSHRLPIPDSLDSLRSSWYRTNKKRRRTMVDKGSQMIYSGQGDLFYTRTGHLGTRQELRRLIRTVSCRGYVATTEPVLSQVGRHVVITQRPLYWVGRVHTNVSVVHVNDIYLLNRNVQWSTAILDHLEPATPTDCRRFPDNRQLTGQLSPTWIRIDTMCPFRQNTVVYVQEPTSSSIQLLEYIFILQTTYQGQPFITLISDCIFTLSYQSAIRVAETMLLEGILI
jgi:hypothetical protein